MGETGIFVVKCGGSTLAALPDSFFADMRKLQQERLMPVVVHGGGPAISALMSRLEIESEFVNGLRRTSEEVLDVVEMVLAGQMNKEIVRRIQLNGAKALGLSGIDGHLFEAEPVANAAEVGFVGEVIGVNSELIRGVVDLGYIPVIAPLGLDRRGQRYNINADTAAGAVASRLGVGQMLVVTDVPGILKEVDGRKKVLPSVTVDEVEAMIRDGEIYGGMIPKVRAAIRCIQGRVKQVVIVDGKEPEVLSRVLRGEAIGTRMIGTAV